MIGCINTKCEKRLTCLKYRATHNPNPQYRSSENRLFGANGNCENFEDASSYASASLTNLLKLLEKKAGINE